MSLLYLLIPALLLGASLLGGVYYMRSRSMKNTKHIFVEATFPNNLTVFQAGDFWNSVAATFSTSSLVPDSQETVVSELRADMNGGTHRIGIPWQHTALLDKLRTHIPGLSDKEMPIKNQPRWRVVEEFGVTDRTRLLNVDRIEAVQKSIMTAMQHDLKEGEFLAVQLVINPLGMVRQVSESEPVVSSHPRAFGLFGSTAGKEEVKERREKLSENQFKVVIRIAAAAKTDTRAKWLMNNVRKSYRELNGGNAYLSDKGRRFLPLAGKIDRFNSAAGAVIYPAQVNTTELVALSGWPVGGPQVPGWKLGGVPYLPPTGAILKNGRRLGLSYQDRPIALSPVDACRHMYVIGPSGLGKTTLLSNSLQQDIERGDGVVVIESKGDLFRAALDAVPKERVNDVVVMDLTDKEWPVGLNPLRSTNKDRQVDELTRLFSRGADSDIYFRDLMYHGLHTLAHFPELTIVDLVPFLMAALKGADPMTKAWRDALIQKLPKNSEFRGYWKTFDHIPDGEKRSRIQPVLNRLWEVTNRADIKNILGQSESTVDLREVMRDNKLLFIYIPDSIGSQTVSLLTSLMFKELWDAVRDVQADKTRPTFMYLDEVQRLGGYIDLAEVLSLARSFKLGLVMAHQHREQLDREQQAAITNTATKVAFRQEGPGAQWLQTLMGQQSVTADAFMALGAYEVIAQIGTDGGTSAPTWFKTLPQFDPHGYADEVVKSSRSQFSRPAKRVNEAILKRRAAPSEPVKARPSFGVMAKEDE